MQLSHGHRSNMYCCYNNTAPTLLATLEYVPYILFLIKDDDAKMDARSSNSIKDAVAYILPCVSLYYKSSKPQSVPMSLIVRHDKSFALSIPWKQAPSLSSPLFMSPSQLYSIGGKMLRSGVLTKLFGHLPILAICTRFTQYRDWSVVSATRQVRLGRCRSP